MYKQLIFIILVISFIFDLYITYRILKQRNKPLPKEVSDIYDTDRYNKFLSYENDLDKVDIIESIFSLVVTFIFLFTPILSLIDKFSNNVYIITLYTFIIIDIIYFIKDISYSYYVTFYIDDKYGLNKMTKKKFFKDYLISDLFEKTVSFILVYGFIFIIEKFIQYCKAITIKEIILWIVGIIAILFLFVTFTRFISLLILRKQYEFKPLDNEELNNKINELQSDSKKKVKHIFVYDESKNSTSKNAFLLKFFWYKEFSIADNFILENSLDEVLAVFAHEIGHLKHKKTSLEYIKYIINFIFILLLISCIINIDSLEHFITSINLEYNLCTTNYYLVFVAFGILLKPILFILKIYQNYISRLNEYEADYNVIKQGYGEVLINTFKSMSYDELIDVNPDPLYEFVNYSHPGMYKRITYIQNCIKQRNNK